MLKIFNDLKPFFEDCYRDLGIREYARLVKVSPPTASSILKKYYFDKILKFNKERNYSLFRANREHKIFIDLCRIYWGDRFVKTGLADFLDMTFKYPVVVLFGSLAKGEVKMNSDIDLAIIGGVKKSIDLNKFEKLFKRKIQIFTFKFLKDIKNIELLENILNGYILRGNLRLKNGGGKVF